MVECLTRDQGAVGSSLSGVTALCPGARHINLSLELVQPRKTHPYITERLLMGHKESNQTNQAKHGKLDVKGRELGILFICLPIGSLFQTGYYDLIIKLSVDLTSATSFKKLNVMLN